MKKIRIYTKTTCDVCKTSKQKLTKFGYTFEEINVDADDDFNALREQFPTVSTVPQIFVGDYRVGGGDSLNSYLDKGLFSDLFN